MRPALSSEIRSAPSGMTSTSAGRPDAALPLSHPAAKVSYDVARPFSTFTKATRYPIGVERFHEPCSAMKMPPRYFSGNIVPV